MPRQDISDAILRLSPHVWISQKSPGLAWPPSCTGAPEAPPIAREPVAGNCIHNVFLPCKLSLCQTGAGGPATETPPERPARRGRSGRPKHPGRKPHIQHGTGLVKATGRTWPDLPLPYPGACARRRGFVDRAPRDERSPPAHTRPARRRAGDGDRASCLPYPTSRPGRRD